MNWSRTSSSPWSGKTYSMLRMMGSFVSAASRASATMASANSAWSRAASATSLRLGADSTRHGARENCIMGNRADVWAYRTNSSSSSPALGCRVPGS